MKNHYSFIGALLQTCSGISGFKVLCRHSWIRTVFHVILMALFCAVLISWGENRRRQPAFLAASKVFENTFGSRILNTESGLVPEKSPGRGRYIDLPDNGRLWYCPSGRVKSSAAELEKFSYILFWAPRGVATALRGKNNEWSVKTVTPDDDIVSSSSARLTSSELAVMVLESKENWDIDDIKNFKVDEIFSVVSKVAAVGFLFQNLLLTLILPFLYTAIFVGMFKLTSGGRYPVNLGTGEFWKLGLYAGFPAMLIASAFPALDLPLFSFSTVFMAGLLIYWLYAAGRVDRGYADTDERNCDEQ